VIGDIAIAAYLDRAPGPFLADLTHRLAPASPSRQPHVTLFPPRQLPGISEPALIRQLESIRELLFPLAIHLGEVKTFLPIAPVVYLEAEAADEQLGRMHNLLLRAFGSNEAAERFEFHPHITLAYELPVGEIAQLRERFQNEWRRYDGPREYTLDDLSLVREEFPLRWRKLASVSLPR
jgi:2'-5' RNA ligase